MNWRYILVGLILIGIVASRLLGTSSNLEPESWVEYEHPTGHFTISFPTSSEPFGHNSNDSSSMGVRWRKSTFQVIWVPQDKKELRMTDKELEEAWINLLSETNSVNSKTSLSYEGFPALDYEAIDNQDGTHQISRFVRGEKMIFEVSVNGNEFSASSPELQKFFASFHIH